MLESTYIRYVGLLVTAPLVRYHLWSIFIAFFRFFLILSDGRYGFIYDGTVWESSDSPQAEADNVYMQCTGCSKWDMLDISNINIPNDLSEWERC